MSATKIENYIDHEDLEFTMHNDDIEYCVGHSNEPTQITKYFYYTAEGIFTVRNGDGKIVYLGANIHDAINTYNYL